MTDKFQVVYRFDNQAMDYLIAGIFTHIEDANTFVAGLSASVKGILKDFTLADIELFLLKNRLRDMAGVLLRMEGKYEPRTFIDGYRAAVDDLGFQGDQLGVDWSGPYDYLKQRLAQKEEPDAGDAHNSGRGQCVAGSEVQAVPPREGSD